MRLGGRAAAAIEVLEMMNARHLPAAIALREWGLSHRFAGSGDRAAIGNIVHDALRRRRSAGFLLGRDEPRAQVFGALIREWNFTPEALNEAFAGDRFAPEGLSEEEIAAISGADLTDAPDVVQADCPDWCVPMLVNQFGDDWVPETAALAERPPLDIRVNTLKSEPPKVQKSLQKQRAGAFPLIGTALRIPAVKEAGRHPNIQAEAGFQKGQYEIQDAGSQIVAALTSASPGELVLDYCAGAGGKTLAMAAAMDNTGQIFAHDADKQRLAPIFERLKRAGCRNVQTVTGAGELERLHRKMDLVLVDAPCTGSGTWRRKPDAKWRLTQAQLETRMAEQSEILSASSKFVKPGGRLAYITCSVFPAENQDQVSKFVRGHTGFVFDDHEKLVERELPELKNSAHIGHDGVLLTPLMTGTDGFFFSMMRKTETV